MGIIFIQTCDDDVTTNQVLNWIYFWDIKKCLRFNSNDNISEYSLRISNLSANIIVNINKNGKIKSSDIYSMW